MGALRLSRVKGTRDLFPEETHRWKAVEEKVHRVFGAYGYGEIRTPALEPTELFARSVGETTDIVHKEMFTFSDRAGRSVTLRPENTAGVVRAIVEEGRVQGPMPLRLYYVGPQYRYERPQKGRYREFRQIGAELFGAPGPEADAELLIMLFELLRSLGFSRLTVALNAVPSGEARERFGQAVRAHAARSAGGLGEDDRRRLAENPLRLFDSKDPAAAEAMKDAPRALDFLDAASRERYGALKRLLAEFGIPHADEPSLVRGLDYYTGTVFEVTSADLGAQDAILGGGRYDNLVSDLGGPPLPAVGFAIGEDRLIDVAPLAPAEPARRIRVIALGGEELGYALRVASELRARAGGDAVVDLDLSGRPFKKALAAAGELGFTEAALIGSQEKTDGTVTLKDLGSRAQRTVPLAEAP